MTGYLSEPNKKSRVALSLQYDGSDFCGWQRQKKGKTIQAELEEAISSFESHVPVKVFAAGRTDAGVHASGQVVHFDYSGPIPTYRWASALNGRLPKTIRVRESVLRPNTWHACYSAKYRRYRYIIYNAKRPNLFLHSWSWHRYQFKLDDLLMRTALEGLIGFHDFRAFQKSGSHRAHAFTSVQSVFLERQGDLIIVEIQASGFLYGMVRLLVGQLVALGEHRLTFKEFQRRWQEGRRSDVKEAAPAKGLFLLRVGYSEVFFEDTACFDCLPSFALRTNDPPQPPIALLD